MDQVEEMLLHYSLEDGDYYLLDAGTILKDLEQGVKESVKWPVLILSRFDSAENVVHERFRPGNPQRPGNNFKLFICHDIYQKSSPEQIGAYNGSRYYRISDQERENFRSIRFLFLSYTPDDDIFDYARELVRNSAS